MTSIKPVINYNVKYYKTVKEAFADANPNMREILCPEAITKNKISIFEVLKNWLKKFNPIKNDTKAGNEKVFEVKQISELLEKYDKRGKIGEVLLKQKIKREGGAIVEELKSIGINI